MSRLTSPEYFRILELLDDSAAGHTLPQAFYTDAGIYDFDMSAVFPRSWLMVGFEAELPEPGSYMALTIGQNPVVIARCALFIIHAAIAGRRFAPTVRDRSENSYVRITNGLTTSMDG